MAKPARKHSKLHVAVIGKNWNRVDQLLNEEPDLLMIQDEYGLTPTHYAAWRAPDDILLKMVATASVDTLNLLTDGVGRSLFHELAYCGRADAIHYLIEKSPSCINQPTKNGNTPLHWCISADLTYEQQLATLKALLQGGADVNLKNNKGQSPGDAYATSSCSKYDETKKQQYKDEIQKLLQRMSFPVEIIARGTAAIDAFKEAMEEGQIEVNQGRVMVLGQERVGKTCMIDSFLGKEFNANQKITNGIATTIVCSKDADDPRKWNEKSTNHKGTMELYNDAIADAIALEILSANEKGKTTDKYDGEKGLDKKDGAPPNLYKGTPAVNQDSLLSVEEKITTEEPVSVSTNGDSSVKERTQEQKYTSTSENKLPRLPRHIMKRVRSRLTDGVSVPRRVSGIHTAEDSTITIWDYGGQLVYHGLHRIFLVARAVYCIVFNLNCKLDEPAIVKDPTTNEIYQYHLTCLEFIQYWINSVYTSIRELREDTTYGVALPVILLVGTHRDSLSNDETQRKLMVKAIFDQLREGMAGQDYEKLVFPHFFDIENNLTLKSNILPLKKQILEFCKGMVKIIPLKWLDFENKLQELMQDHLTLPIVKVNELVYSCGIKEEFKQTLLDYFCDLGIIVYFANHHILKEVVVINPMGLVEVLKSVITVIEPEFQTAMQKQSWRKLNQGILEEKLLKYLWEKVGITLQEEVNYLVALMQKLGLICECKSMKASDLGRTFFVPMRLQPTLSEELRYLDHNQQSTSLYFDFSGYFPDDLSHHLFARVIDRFQMKDEEKPTLCHNQLVMHLDETCLLSLSRITIKNRRMLQMTITPKLVVSENGNQNQLQLSPATCTKVLNGVTEELLGMRDSWRRGISWEVCIPCVACKRPNDPHLHALKKCLNKSILGCGSRGMETACFKRLFAHKQQTKKVQESDESQVPPQHDEGFVDYGVISTISENVRIGWKRFGVRLGVPWSKIKLIETEYGQTKTAVVIMMEYWRDHIARDSDQMKDVCVALRVHNQKLAESLYPEDLSQIVQKLDARDAEKVNFNDQDLLFVCDKLRVSDWRRFFVRLGMQWNEISELAYGNRNTRDSMMDCLAMWRDRLKSNHCVVLVDALKKQRLVALADDVCERFGATPQQIEEVEHHHFGYGGYIQDIDLMFIAEKLGRKWKDFLRCLGLDDTELEYIEAEFSNVDAILESLVRWRDRQGRNSNQLEQFIDALTEHDRKDIIHFIKYN